MSETNAQAREKISFRLLNIIKFLTKLNFSLRYVCQ